jgi:hypothetical protein
MPAPASTTHIAGTGDWSQQLADVTGWESAPPSSLAVAQWLSAGPGVAIPGLAHVSAPASLEVPGEPSGLPLPLLDEQAARTSAAAAKALASQLARTLFDWSAAGFSLIRSSAMIAA